MPGRFLVHDRDPVLTNLAYDIAHGSEVCSATSGLLSDQHELVGPVSSVATCWWELSEIAVGGGRILARTVTAVNAVWRLACEAGQLSMAPPWRLYAHLPKRRQLLRKRR